MDTTAATPTTRCSTSRPQLITTITGLVVTGRPPATQPRHRRPNVYYRPETRDVTVTSSHRHGGATCWTGVTDVENTAATRLNSTQLNGDCEQRLPLERAMSIVYSCSIQYCSMCHASRRALHGAASAHVLARPVVAIAATYIIKQTTDERPRPPAALLLLLVLCVPS